MITVQRAFRCSALVASIAIMPGACDSAGNLPVTPDAPDTWLAGRATAAEQQQIAAMRQATAKYHNIEVARQDGYVDDGFGCISDPVLGGMGWHLIHEPLHADPAIDPLRPELLIYEPQPNGGMQLIAVEYEVYQADWLGAGHSQPPEMFGRPFEALEFPGLDPVYGFHIWLWRNNPAGMFEDFNPNIVCQ